MKLQLHQRMHQSISQAKEITGFFVLSYWQSHAYCYLIVIIVKYYKKRGLKIPCLLTYKYI